MMLDIFLMLGVLIPLIASNFFFNEVIKPSQWIGIAILLVAVGIMCSYNNSIKAKITPFSLVLLIICGIANGIADFFTKAFCQVHLGWFSSGLQFLYLCIRCAHSDCIRFRNRKDRANRRRVEYKISFLAIF